jgi:hypothetical protein
MRSRYLTLIAAGLLLSVGQAQAQDIDFAGLSDELRANDSVDVGLEDGTMVAHLCYTETGSADATAATGRVRNAIR